MDEITLALCKKPAIGILMWLSSFCATNQALKNAFFEEEKVTIKQEYHVPMDENYTLLAHLKSINNELNKKSWDELLCKNGSEINIAIEIKYRDSPVIYQENFNQTCSTKNDIEWNTVKLGEIFLKKGDTIIIATNKGPALIHNNQKFQIILVGQKSTGFP